MKIKKVSVKSFKRFTDLVVDGFPDTTRLVVIAGPNGSGKSSFFEALRLWSTVRSRGLNPDLSYYAKQEPLQTFNQMNSVEIEFHGAQPSVSETIKKSFYVRSAYRNDPDFTHGSISRTGPAVDEVRFQRLIDNDQAISTNYQRITGQVFEYSLESGPAAMTLGDFRVQAIGEVQASVSRLFPDLVLNGLGNPLTNGTFKFTKGTASGFLFKNLSGGEKGAFDLILDLIVKQVEFDDTIFCIDEPEAHMNPRLHGPLLLELFNLLKDNSQLWVATHSIGMLRQARDIEKQYPGTVAFIDFGGLNFDFQQFIRPVRPSRRFWERALDVAFADLAALVAPHEIILCEGKAVGSGGPGEQIDARCYNTIFETTHGDTKFVSIGASTDIEKNLSVVMAATKAVAGGVGVRRLRDRDELSSHEVSERRQLGISVLSRRHLESYMYDDEVLIKLCVSSDHPEHASALVTYAAERRAASIARQNPTDDVKSTANEIAARAKQLLGLQASGSNGREFMATMLAPLITPGMEVYRELESDIFSIYIAPDSTRFAA